MGTWAGTEVKPWPGTLPVMSPLPPLTRGATVGHTGSHAVRIRTLFNVHGVKFPKTCSVNEKVKIFTPQYLGNQDGAHHELFGFGLGAAPRAQIR